MKHIALMALRLYQQAISPHLRATCRFYPPCSEYSHQAIQRYGFLKGLWLSLRRLARCHPLGSMGYDPVP